MSALSIPAEVFAALFTAPTPEEAAAELAHPGYARVRIPVNPTTLPIWGRPADIRWGAGTSATLYAPLAWPATGEADWAQAREVRIFATAIGGDALAVAAIPPAYLPPSRRLPGAAEPYTLPGGVLTLTFA